MNLRGRHFVCGRLVGWLVGWSVCHNFLRGREVTLLCSYWSTSLLSDGRDACFDFIKMLNVTFLF